MKELNKEELFSKRYDQHLSKIQGITLMPELAGTFSNRWLTAILVEEEMLGISKEQILDDLSEMNIEARPVWKPLHMQPLFEGVAYYSHHEHENVSETLFNKGICLPSGSNMSVEDQMRIINCIKSCVESRDRKKLINEVI